MNVTSKTVFNDELYNRFVKTFKVTQLFISVILFIFIIFCVVIGFLVNYIAFIPCVFIFIILIISFVLSKKSINNMIKSMKEKFSTCICEFNFLKTGFIVNYILDDTVSTVEYEISDIEKISRNNKLTFITLTNNELLIVDEINLSNKDIYEEILKKYV